MEGLENGRRESRAEECGDGKSWKGKRRRDREERGEVEKGVDKSPCERSDWRGEKGRGEA